MKHLAFYLALIFSVNASAQNNEKQSTLVVLNVSGWTLISSDQEVTDNGNDLVSLPRSTFTKLTISPGQHEFRFKLFPQGRRVATLNAEAGKTYYLIVGYSPSKSWVLPIAGDPMMIKIGSEEEAREALKDMHER